MADGSFEGFLATYSPAVQDLARRSRVLVLEMLPGALEMVEPPSKIIAYGYSRKYTDLTCAIAPYQTYVNLIFSRGVQLLDPQFLLSGAGKRARHIKITTPEDLAQPAVRSILAAALDLYHQS